MLDCTLEMLQQAKLEQWLDVMQTGVQRQRLIENFFEEPVAAREADEVAPVLRKMLQVNEEIETLAINSRGGVSRSIGSIQQGRRAMLAYAENTGEVTGASGQK